MGYDMYWVHTPEKQERELAELSERMTAIFLRRVDNEPISAQDAAAIDVLSAERTKIETNYFRLNIWGMQAARELLFRFDMTYDSNPGSWDESVDPAEALSQSGVDESRPGIAIHKLCSNDSWVVTPRECMTALDQWRTYTASLGLGLDYVPVDADGNQIEWWQEFLAFLSGAAVNGGFCVY